MAVDEAAAGKLIEFLAAPREERDNRLVRMSSIGNCTRQIAYQIMGAPAQPEELASLVTFEIGHSFHRMGQLWLQQMGWLLPALTEFTMIDPARRRRGTTDGVSERLTLAGELAPEGTRRIFELKSITDNPLEHAGKRLAGGFTRLSKPKEKHLDQATGYAMLWNDMLSEGKFPGMDAEGDRVTHLTFVYICKDAEDRDVMPVKVYTQPLSAKRMAKLTAKVTNLWAKLDNEELPDRDYDPWSPFSFCHFCPWVTLCKGLE